MSSHILFFTVVNSTIFIFGALSVRKAFHTLMCLSIGTPKIINFQLFSKAKLIIFRCPKIKVHDSLIMM